jgi:mannose-1-phosphate guanylyltransferase
LPLLSEQTLFQRTIGRLDGLIDDITVVAAQRHEPLVRDQAPGVQVLVEPMGRNTLAAIGLAAIAIDRHPDDVMVVLPADQTIAKPDVFQGVLRAAHDELALGAFDIDSPLVALGVEMTRPATEYGYLIPDRDRTQSKRLTSYVLKGFEEKPTLTRAQELYTEGRGIAWNAGMFLWRRRAILAAIERYTALIQLLKPSLGSAGLLEQAYEQLQPVSIDYAVMEKAAGHGQVVMGAMDVGWSDLGSWSALLEALAVDGSGSVVQAGETVEVEPGDLVVRRNGGRVSAVPPIERGSMTATQPIAVLRGARTSAGSIDALLERCSDPEVET